MLHGNKWFWWDMVAYDDVNLFTASGSTDQLHFKIHSNLASGNKDISEQLHGELS